MHWFLDPITKHYADFNGRTTRQEFWMCMLYHTIFGLVLLMTFFINDLFKILFGLYVLGIIIPSISITVRRLHDIGRSGWWILLNFVPYIGGIVLLVFYCLPSEKGTNKYGPNKYGVAAVETPVPPTESVVPPTTAV